jgi:cytosine/adenosine deaminase-related metal-dependent hydrolase
VARPVRLPGFVNAHSHAFQRALRGKVEGGDFWAWREGMLAEADRHTQQTVREFYARVYREMRSAGFTAVGEFHFQGAATADAAADSSSQAALGVVWLQVA